ncbi:nematode resistance protein-like HSPRO2 [Salvia hispanica]|uniref:nematode resistance protein-like HSPRO2 n=1 Tax=Salvia hispanica TaxID=49212 RepID=UPI002009AAC1|nr:nematode resistance protein-like HSPRO2 [Salvia hispanica]
MADDDTVVVSHVSEESLLPRLASWQKYEGVARRIQYSIECQMQGLPYTLGLGEPNLSGKPSLNYDQICKPAAVHSLKKCSIDGVETKNFENRTVYSTHQVLESWIRVARGLIARIGEEIDSRRWERAARDCWLLEKVWSILNQIEDLHLLMDPDDFLQLKNQLVIKASSDSELFCFRSRELVEITKSSKDLKHTVPAVLEVEVDPSGGPRIQDAAMELYRKKEDFAKIHLLQAMQAVEAAVKRFYFGYKQLLAVVMGSLEAKGNVESGDLLSQIFTEPTYFPSLDAAKTFLGERWSHDFLINFEFEDENGERATMGSWTMTILASSFTRNHKSGVGVDLGLACGRVRWENLRSRSMTCMISGNTKEELEPDAEVEDLERQGLLSRGS